MGKNDIARATRHQKRHRVLGTDAVCEQCGWSDGTALTKTKDDRVLCYECLCGETARAVIEQHHHLGRAVDPATIPVLGNIHRDLSDRQREWPAIVRSNPQRDLLVWIAAALLGLRDHLTWWIEWVDVIAAFLIDLSTPLVQYLGERWWEVLGVTPVWQRAMS